MLSYGTPPSLFSYQIRFPITGIRWLLLVRPTIDLRYQDTYSQGLLVSGVGPIAENCKIEGKWLQEVDRKEKLPNTYYSVNH